LGFLALRLGFLALRLGFLALRLGFLALRLGFLALRLGFLAFVSPYLSLPSTLVLCNVQEHHLSPAFLDSAHWLLSVIFPYSDDDKILFR
jgi:hypothetical protein